MRRLSRLLALCAVLLVVAAGCSAGSGSTGSGSSDTQQVTLGLVAEPASLDFTRNDGAAIPQVLLGNVYEGLVELDQEGDIAPALATSWSVSPDRKTYTFELTPDATFSNGTAFTAADAVFSINYVKSSWTTSLARGMDVVEEATAVDDTTLQVRLSQPSNTWLYRMTTRIGAMMTESGVGDLATTPVGTGPYTFGSWNRGDSIQLQANPDYWGQQPAFSTVTLKYFKDPTALNNALLTGSIDVITTVQAPEALAQFTGNSAYQVIEGTTNGEVVLSFNNAQPVFADQRVRLAIRHAIDHDGLLTTCWAGKGTLIGSMVPPTDPWYEDLTGVTPYDPDTARSLLAEAGASGATLRLRVPTLPYAVSCGQVVKSQLEAVGFTVAMDQLEFPASWLAQVFKGGDFDLSIVAHVEPRDLPSVFGNPAYYTKYDNPQVRDAIAAADVGTEQEQVDEMKVAARLLAEDGAADFLFLLPNLMVAEQGITGLPENAISESLDLSALSRS